MKAPMVYFGGKRRVAAQVWSALGDVDSYVEPFCGSAAVLLERPKWHRGSVETINDVDAHLCNVWRALAAAPDEVAMWCDRPVDETELVARHLWLVNEGRARVARLEVDPDFYDARAAGYWLYGINSWIGSGWCSGGGPHTRESVAAGGQLPHLGNPGQGVNRQLQALTDPACSPSASTTRLASDGLYLYCAELAKRLRRVRVCCGGWSRVVTAGALAHGETVGIFLDPPYSGDVRTANLYSSDDHDVAIEVREWAVSNGDNPRYRIVLCGYEDEHAEAMPPTWRMVYGRATAAYQTRASAGGDSGNQANRRKERIWFSPHCIDTAPGLFSVVRQCTETEP